MAMTSLDERMLVEAHNGGDVDAFVSIVNEYSPSLYAHAVMRLGEPRAAEDAVQETYLRAYRAMPRFEGEFASFGGIQCRPRPHRPGGPPVLASGMSTAAHRRAVARCDGWYGFFQDLDHTRDALAELGRLAGEVDRPAELGRLEITITPLPGPIDADTVRRYEDLGVDGLVLVPDFADMAGGPDAARRGKFLDEMKACAERLDIT